MERELDASTRGADASSGPRSSAPVAVAGTLRDRDPTLRLWAIPAGEPRGVFKKLSDVSISPSRRQLATVDGTAMLSLWDSAEDRLLEQLPTAQGLQFVVFVAHSGRIAPPRRGLATLAAGGWARGRAPVIVPVSGGCSA